MGCSSGAYDEYFGAERLRLFYVVPCAVGAAMGARHFDVITDSESLQDFCGLGHYIQVTGTPHKDCYIVLSVAHGLSRSDSIKMRVPGCAIMVRATRCLFDNASRRSSACQWLHKLWLAHPEAMAPELSRPVPCHRQLRSFG